MRLSLLAALWSSPGAHAHLHRPEPAVNVSRAPHFDCSDAALVTALQTDGFAVVRQAAEPADLSRASVLLWKLMWQEAGWDRRDASTWTDESLAKLDPGAWATGILSADRIGQSELAWLIRSLPRVRCAFRLQAVQGFVSLSDQDLCRVATSHPFARTKSPGSIGHLTEQLLPPFLVEPRDGTSQQAGPLPRWPHCPPSAEETALRAEPTSASRRLRLHDAEELGNADGPTSETAGLRTGADDRSLASSRAQENIIPTELAAGRAGGVGVAGR
eukprot:s2195_g20.t2